MNVVHIRFKSQGRGGAERSVAVNADVFRRAILCGYHYLRAVEKEEGPMSPLVDKQAKEWTLDIGMDVED